MPVWKNTEVFYFLEFLFSR